MSDSRKICILQSQGKDVWAWKEAAILNKYNHLFSMKITIFIHYVKFYTWICLKNMPDVALQ